MAERISASEALPFLDPKASQASDSGANEAWPNTPPPAIAESSPFNLNRNRSPGCSALNSPEPEGCQKLTSSGAMPARKSNQGLCITPTKILTTQSP